MEPRTNTSLAINPEALIAGRDEMNFAEISPTLLTDRAPAGQTFFRRELRLYDPKRKKWITGIQFVEGSQEHGLPTAGDNLVHLALIQLTKHKNNFAKPDVEFTRQELLGLLGWSDQGRNYQRIEKALLRLKHVTYEYKNAWWDHRQKTYTTRAFSIIDNVDINDSRNTNNQGDLFLSRIKWNEVIFDSFQSGYLRAIDFEQCRRFRHPVALQMYRFLGKREHLGSEVAVPLKAFAFGHIGLTGNYTDKAQIARKLRPAFDELESIGFLVPLPDGERYVRRDDEWWVRLVFVTQQEAAVPAGGCSPALPPAHPLARALADRGVTARIAADLARDHPAGLVEQQIEAFDWLAERKDRRIQRSPAGYLVASIRDGYAVPPGFVSRAQRQAEADRNVQAKRRTEEARRDAAQEGARERAERIAVRDYWNSLTPEQQEALDARVIAEADPATLGEADATPEMLSLCKSLLRDRYIRNLLQQQQVV
ncbi:MAG: replication initiator protein A [Isosphaeraceae bacterium]